MTDEQYSNMMIAFAKLEAKIDCLEQEIKLLSKVTDFEAEYDTVKPVPAESFSRFLNLDNLKAETVATAGL